MNTQQMIDVMGDICALEDKTLEAFVALFKCRELKKGEDFISEGELGDSFAFIQSGLLRSFYISPKGEEYNKHFFMGGSFVAPLTSLVLNRPSPLYIGALENSELLVASASALSELYVSHIDLNILGRKLVEYAWIGKERRETQLVMLDATERYSGFLQDFPGLDQRIPQYHIASYLGITPVQLSRIRSASSAGK
jgi:CRP-like cAMP-binding protein